MKRWVCTAPFGRPVVPEVYSMMAGSASATGGSRGWAGALSSSAKATTPSAWSPPSPAAPASAAPASSTTTTTSRPPSAARSRLASAR